MSNRLLHNRFVDWCLPVGVEDRGDFEELRARLLPAFTAGLILAGLVFLLLYGGLFRLVSAVWIIAVGVITVSLTPAAMRWTGRIDLAGHWMSLNLYSVLVGLALLTGGIEAPASWWLAAVPAYALVFAGLQAAVGWASLVLITVAAFYHAGALGLPVTQQLNEVEIMQLQVLGITGLTFLIAELFFFYGWVRELIDELEQAHHQLRADQRRRNHFLAMLGHELRNPFSAIANTVAYLKHKSSPDEMSRQVEMLDRQTDKLGRLLDDLLDIARLARGTFELRCEPVDLNACIRSAITTVESQFSDTRRSLIVELPDRPVRVYADPVRLEQIFSNLLTNAFKYTDKGGEIRVEVCEAERGVDVRVEDDGRGLSGEELERVFELFERGRDSVYDAARDGLGVGLTVVRRLVELHEGRVEAHSLGEDRGSVFIVHLPVSEPDDERSGAGRC